MAHHAQIYIDHSRGASSDQIYVPAMGLHEPMPPGFIRHGGAGSKHPCLIMIFHSPAWALAPDRSDWLPVERRLIVWDYEAEHHYGNLDKAWDHSWLQVSGRWMERALRQTAMPLGVPLDLGGDVRPLRYLQLISDELRGQVVQDPDMLEGLLKVFWHDIERQVTPSPARKHLDPRLEKARRFIEIHFDRPFSLAEIAKEAHLSPSYFCQSFARRFGVPPREYAMRFRLQRAAQLLANQDLAVFEVAEMVGCDDALYFSRLFRKRYGLSPAQFRRRQDRSIDGPGNGPASRLSVKMPVKTITP